MTEGALDKHSLEIEGVEAFRRVMVISSMIFGSISIIILAIDPAVCYKDPNQAFVGAPVYDLGTAIWITFGV